MPSMTMKGRNQMPVTRSRELGKSERGKVSVRQSDFQRWGVRQVPRTIGAARGARGFLRSDAAPAELAMPGGSAFPLFPDHRPDLHSSHGCGV
jgi:hypothetical protein